MAEFKVIAISDTHNQLKKILNKIPNGDFIIHAGDATSMGTFDEVKQFCQELGSLPHKYKLFVPGNHDWLFESDEIKARKLCEDNGILCLIDETVEVGNITIYGSPVTPWFNSWAFNRVRGNADVMYCPQTRRTLFGKPIKPHWNLIPDNTDILITHGPAYGILDKTMHGLHVGCEELTKKIMSIKPDIHISGHIHHSFGQQHIDGISFYNVSVCDENYFPTNSVTEIKYIKVD